MRKIRRFTALIPAMILWLMFSVLLWGFVFTRITDTAREYKITLFVDAQVPGATEMAEILEARIGGNIRMVKVCPFMYAMLDGTELTQADLFIVPLSHVETYKEWFDPLPEEMRGMSEELTADGEIRGLRVFSAETGRGAAGAYIDYVPSGEEKEDFYLLFGSQSLHVPGHEGAVDDAALTAARYFLETE